MRYKAASLDDLQKVAESLIQHLPQRGVVCFEGEMGVGKTTLIAMLCKMWGVDDPIGSPTYALVNEYEGTEHSRIYHFDLYRLNAPEEALDIGIEDYFAANAICLIEWPERLGFLRPENAFNVRMEDVQGVRLIVLEA